MFDAAEAEALNNARREITEVLRRLEATLNREVTDLEVRRTEVTNLRDDRPTFIKHVFIGIKPDELNTWG